MQQLLHILRFLISTARIKELSQCRDPMLVLCSCTFSVFYNGCLLLILNCLCCIHSLSCYQLLYFQFWCFYVGKSIAILDSSLPLCHRLLQINKSWLSYLMVLHLFSESKPKTCHPEEEAAKDKD